MCGTSLVAVKLGKKRSQSHLKSEAPAHVGAKSEAVGIGIRAYSSETVLIARHRSGPVGLRNFNASPSLPDMNSLPVSI